MNSKTDGSGFHGNVKIHGHHAACMADLVFLHVAIKIFFGRRVLNGYFFLDIRFELRFQSKKFKFWLMHECGWRNSEPVLK